MKKYERITRNYIDKKALYNFSNLNYTKVPYSQLAKKASKFYLKALTNCTNPELASKLKYYLAKCELNYIYNNEEDYNLSQVNYYNSKYKKRLQEIREDDSDFSRQIIKECTYFNIF